MSPEGMQVQTAGLAPYVPLNGTIFRGNTDWYTFMSFLSAGVGLRMAQIEAALEDEALGAELRKMFAVMMKVRRLFNGDYYQLTPVTLDDRDWFAYRLHMPETGEGAVLSFRRENCPVNSANYLLPGLCPDKEYVFEDIQLKGPENYDAYLTQIYGDYMELPPINKRKTHCTQVFIRT